MKLKVNWKELMKQLWTAIKPVLLCAIGGAGATVKLTLADGTELTRSVAIEE